MELSALAVAIKAIQQTPKIPEGWKEGMESKTFRVETTVGSTLNECQLQQSDSVPDRDSHIDDGVAVVQIVAMGTDQLKIAVCLCALIFAGCAGELGVNPHKSDTEIRQQLLAHTPKGTSGTKVLGLLVSEIGERNLPKRFVQAYPSYVDALQASTGHRLLVTPLKQRIISAEVAQRAFGIIYAESVTAIWHFDHRGRLTEITIDRLNTCAFGSTGGLPKPGYCIASSP